MFKTAIENNNKNEEFDWETFFNPQTGEILERLDNRQLLARLREHLKEDKFRLTLALSKLMWTLLKGREPENPRILELGAATGVLTRWLLHEFGGSGVLVDRSNASYEAYEIMEDSLKERITYIREDIFKIQLEERFDLVCSFGLIEHFEDKTEVIAAHKQYVAPGGQIIILVPMDTPLGRVYTEVFPELNLGYRELLTKKEFKKILLRQGLEIQNIAISSGYAYDFIGAVCRIAEAS